jgi:hypothetical protein
VLNWTAWVLKISPFIDTFTTPLQKPLVQTVYIINFHSLVSSSFADLSHVLRNLQTNVTFLLSFNRILLLLESHTHAIN